MKKKFLSVLLVLLTVFALIPITSTAASSPVSSCIDLAAINNDTFGNGYRWDNLDCILTLDGLNLNTTDAFGIKLPAGNSAEGTTVILNGNNAIKASSYGIQCLGKLTFKGEGTLTVTAAESGISGVSSQEKHSIVFRSGSITVNGAKQGIYVENSELVFSGSKITINASESSIFGKNIKIVSGTLELTGKIKAKGTLAVSNANLSVSALDKALDAERGVTFTDVKLSTGDTLSTLKSAEEYNGEKAIKTVGTKVEKNNGFLFGGKLPAFVDYIVIVLIIVAAAAVITVPIIIKRKKTAKLIAENEAKKSKKNKKKR